MSSASASGGFSERVAEAAGPIVVKEVRQGLRAKVFAVFFGLLLLGCLVVALIAAAEFDRRRNDELGPEYFRLFLFALAIVEYFVIPYTAYRAMSREREDETWVLLVLTGLGARRIVRGKISSALAQGLLYASACAPFVLFSYYLNGIDLPTVLIALVLAASWSVLLVCVAVAAATQATSRIGRGLVHFLVLGLLLAGTGTGIAFSAFFSEDAGRLLREQAGFGGFCAALVVWELTSAWVLSEGAASGLALLSENAARGPRLALVAQTTIAVCITAVALLFVTDVEDQLIFAASIATSLHLLVCAIFAASEHDGFPPAFARARIWAKPGAVRSFGLVALLMLFATGAWFGLFQHFGGEDSKSARMMLLGPLYVLLYVSLGVLLGRLSPLKRLGEPVATRAGFAIATVLGVTVPMFLAVLSARDAFSKPMNMFNPILGFAGVNGGRRGEMTLMLVGAAALLFGFLAFSVLSTRDVERRA